MHDRVKRLSPHHRRAAELAQLAKQTPNGIIVHFFTEDYPDKDTAKRTARAFQIAFSNMRARERQRAMRASQALNGFVNAEEFEGPYDQVGAYLREQPGSWEVRLRIEPPDIIRITDGDNRPLKQFTSEGERWTVLWGKIADAYTLAQIEKRSFVNPLTDEEATFMSSHDGSAYRQLMQQLIGEEPDDAPQASQKETTEAS